MPIPKKGSMGCLSTMDDGERYMKDTPKPPMVVYGRRLHPSTDLDGNIISENWMATTSDHPLMKGETYVHLDQFLAEVERRAMAMVEKDAMQELAKELKEK